MFSRNWKFYVVDITADNNLIIKQWDYKKKGGKENKIIKDEMVTSDASKAYAREESNNQFFILDLNQFNDKCDPYFAQGADFTIGVMTIPIKLRAGNDVDKYFEFEEKFNMGISAGLKYNINSRKDRSVSLLVNASVSSVRLDSLNTAGYQHTSTCTAAFTIACGLLYQQDNINVGFFLGWDKVPGILGRKWQQNGLPWVGVGGYCTFQF